MFHFDLLQGEGVSFGNPETGPFDIFQMKCFAVSLRPALHKKEKDNLRFLKVSQIQSNCPKIRLLFLISPKKRNTCFDSE